VKAECLPYARKVRLRERKLRFAWIGFARTGRTVSPNWRRLRGQRFDHDYVLVLEPTGRRT